MRGLTIKSTPLPRWLVLGNSAIVIGLSAAFAGLVLGKIVVTWNSCSMLGMLILLSFPLAVGCLQYTAGFRKNRKAAKAVEGLHACGFLLPGLIIPLMVGALIDWKEISISACVDVCLVIGAFIYCGFCCWMNARMANYLRKAEEAADLPNAMVGTGRFQFTLRELLGTITVLSIMASFASYIIHDAHKSFEEHITSEEVPARLIQLPEGADDVCYCLSAHGTLAYEFDIDEPGFHAWAQRILEISSASPDVSASKIAPGNIFRISDYMKVRYPSPFYDEAQMCIGQGYYCEHKKDDKWFKLGYDVTTGRAYYCGMVFVPKQTYSISD